MEPQTPSTRPEAGLDAPAAAQAPPGEPRADAPARRWRDGVKRGLLFALNFLKHPLTVGTFVESSPALVRRLLDGVDWRHCRAVVELGPGTGAVTRELLARLPGEARLLVVETNADFVASLRRTIADPRLAVVHGSAADLRAHLRAQGIAAVDAAISGIPFSTMPVPVRGAVLDAVRDALRPDGRLLVYQHSNRVLPLLRDRFAHVLRETEWRNLLPMRLFRCERPIRGEVEAGSAG